MAKLALILLSTYFFVGNLLAGGLVLRSETIPTPMFNCSDIASVEVFTDVDNKTFISVMVMNPYGRDFLHMNNNWVPTDKYGIFLNGFLKDGRVYLAMKKDENIVIYKVHKDIEPVSRISVADSLGKRLQSNNVDRVMSVPGLGKSYYLLASRWCFPVNPVEFLKTVFSAGHGVYYWKPFLVEVSGEKLTKPRKLRYGGKVNESYYIKDVEQSGDLAHFLGFRMQEEPDWGSPIRAFESRMLHHAAYDLKKKKVIHTHTIYTNTPKTEINFYGPLSIDALGDDVFVAFSWVQQRAQPRPIPIKDIKSTIYYWHYSDGVAGDVEKIADGFLPLVRVDSSGSVHVLWVDKNARLVHKAKRNGKWGKDTVLVNNLDVDYGVIATKNIAAEFDNDNNLHVVYPSGGNLVHAVVKVN